MGGCCERAWCNGRWFFRISAQKVNDTMDGSYTVSLNGQANGIYFVEVKTNDSRVVKKINVVK